MAVKGAGAGQITCLYSDTKPTLPAGYRAFETDTGDILVSDGTYWWLTGAPAVMSPRKYGSLALGNTITQGTGMFTLFTNATGIGTTNSVISDATNGKYATFPTGTTTGNKGGMRINSSLFTSRPFNPKMYIKFKLETTTLQRIYLGFATNAEPTGDDPYGSGTVAFMIGHISGDTNFKIIHNDTSGATVFDDTGTALNTSIHTIKLVADEANTRFSWSLDGGTYSHVTTNIPSATNNLTVVFQSETNESGVAKTFDIFAASMNTDK